MNHNRVERLWRREGLKVPPRQPKRRRLWLNDGSCIRLRPAYLDQVWSYDLVTARTSDGRALRLLMIIDEFSRECLAIEVARRLTSDVLDRLTELVARSRAVTQEEVDSRSLPVRLRDGVAKLFSPFL